MMNQMAPPTLKKLRNDNSRPKPISRRREAKLPARERRMLTQKAGRQAPWRIPARSSREIAVMRCRPPVVTYLSQPAGRRQTTTRSVNPCRQPPKPETPSMGRQLPRPATLSIGWQPLKPAKLSIGRQLPKTCQKKIRRRRRRSLGNGV